MKFNATKLGLFSAVSVLFWYVASTIILMLLPAGTFQYFLARVPFNMVSLMVVNAFIIVVAVFLTVTTTAFLYNRYTK